MNVDNISSIIQSKQFGETEADEIAKSPDKLVSLLKLACNTENHWYSSQTKELSLLINRIEKLDSENQFSVKEIEKIVKVYTRISPNLEDFELRESSHQFFEKHTDIDNIFEHLRLAKDSNNDEYMKMCFDYIEERTQVKLTINNDSSLLMDVTGSFKLSDGNFLKTVKTLSEIYKGNIVINLTTGRGLKDPLNNEFLKIHGNNVKSLNLSSGALLGELIILLPNLLHLEMNSENVTDDHLLALRSGVNLITLNLSWSKNLTSLPDLRALKNLETLNLSYCTKLATLPSFDTFANLETLDLSGCEKLKILPSLNALINLKTLDLSNNLLSELPDINALTNLETLNLKGFADLTTCPNINELTRLKSLVLSNWYNLNLLPDLSKFKNLENLDISSCYKITEMPDLSFFPNLINLNLQYSKNLKSFNGLETLTHLKSLKLAGKYDLTSIPNLDALTNLTTFNDLDLMDQMSILGVPQGKEKTLKQEIIKNYFLSHIGSKKIFDIRQTVSNALVRMEEKLAPEKPTSLFLNEMSKAEPEFIIWRKLAAQVKVWESMQLNKKMRDFPFEEIWRFAIDGKFEDTCGPYYFEDEPGYIASYLSGLDFAMNQNTLSASGYIDLHDCIIAGTKKKENGKLVPFPMGLRTIPVGYPVSKLDQDALGIQDLQNRSLGNNNSLDIKGLPPPVQFVFQDNTVAAIGSNPNDFLESIFNVYHEKMKKVTTSEERLLASIWIVRELEINHVFEDANGRSSIVELLGFLARDPELPMALFYDPNILDVNGPEKLCYRVLEAMMNFKQNGHYRVKDLSKDILNLSDFDFGSGSVEDLVALRDSLIPLVAGKPWDDIHQWMVA